MAKQANKSRKKIGILVLGIIVILFLIILGPVIFKLIEVRILQSKISSFYEAQESLDNKKPGDVLKIEPMTSPVLGGKAYRIMYVSQHADDKKVPVSGMVFVSSKNSSQKNIVAWAHGTVGLGQNCAPSRRLVPTANLEPWLSMMMDKGWIVVATDYSGLGIKGQNQYLVGESEGHDVLNSIRAVKTLGQFNPGDKAIVFGHSQGGHSALFAGNMQTDYAPELNLLGVVAAAPAAELNSLFQLQHNRPLVWAIAPELYVSWVNQFKLPTDIISPDYQKSESNRKIADLCVDDRAAQAIFVAKSKSDYFAKDPNTNITWYKAFKKETPDPAIDKPLLILQGLNDTVVLPQTTALFVQKSCRLSTDIASLWYKNVNHLELPNVTSDDSVSWINDRFNNVPTQSNCNLPLPVSPAQEVAEPLN